MSLAGRVLSVAVMATLLLAHTGNALKCFSCSSDTDPRCKDYFEKSHYALKDCEDERRSHYNMEPYCRKVIQTGDPNNQQKETIRSCAWADPGDMDSICRESTPSHLNQLHCSICRTDACNGARSSALPSAAVACLLPAVVAAFFKSS